MTPPKKSIKFDDAMQRGRFALRTLARLLRPGGRALLLGGGGPSGSAAAARKAARKRQPGVWAERACVECRCGGIDAVAVVLERSDSLY